MLNYSPPPGFDDVSEYTFTNNNRRVIIRSTQELGSSHGPHDLQQVAQDFAAHLQNYLGAQSPQISEVRTRPDKAQYVTVTAQIAEGSHPLLERAAFILFVNGKAIQLSMSASPEDAPAAAEFDAMVQTARPAPPQTTGRRLLRHDSTDTIPKERFAGAALVDLPSEYRNVTTFKFRNPEKTRLLSIKVDEAPPGQTEFPRTLFAASKSAHDELGRPFIYESGRHLWKPRIARSKVPFEASALATPQVTPITPFIDEVRQIGNSRVTIHVHSTEPDPGAQYLAKTVSASIGSDQTMPH
jgi:hypothetical protein